MEHLPKVCPHKPIANPQGNLGPNQGLNYIEVVPSPFAEEEEKDRASLRVVTRAQTPKNPEKDEPQALEATQKKFFKRKNWRGRPRKEGKKSNSDSEPKLSEEDKGGSTKKNREQEPTKTTKARTSSSSSQEEGSILIDKK